MITAAEVEGNAMRDDATWTKEILLKEVRGSHPLLADAEFAYAPDWTTAEIPSEADKWNLCFTIVDPDDSIAKNVVASRIIMFATVVTPDHWKEKINLQQCNICWQLTGPHKACMQHQDGKARGCKKCRKSCKPACRLCGSLSHTEEQHNPPCKQCIQTGESMEKIKHVDWKCTHLQCAVCTGPHFSDSIECPGRNEAIQQAKGRKPTYGQPFLQQDSFIQARPPRPAYPSSYPEVGPNHLTYTRPQPTRAPKRKYALKNQQRNATPGPSNLSTKF